MPELKRNRFFVARNKMNGSRRLLWYGISHILIVIPLYNLFIDARLGDTQVTDPRIRASETKKSCHYWETPRSVRLLFRTFAPLKVGYQDALIIRNWRLEGLWLDDVLSWKISWSYMSCELRTRDALSLNHSILHFIIMCTCNYNKFVDDAKVRSAGNFVNISARAQNHTLSTVPKLVARKSSRSR
jgi:hypothetical protein